MNRAERRREERENKRNLRKVMKSMKSKYCKGSIILTDNKRLQKTKKELEGQGLSVDVMEI